MQGPVLSRKFSPTMFTSSLSKGYLLFCVCMPCICTHWYHTCMWKSAINFFLYMGYRDQTQDIMHP